MAGLQKIDAVILCGGMGSRLRPKIGETQKAMAQFENEPFLNFILSYLKEQGFRRVILCTGYKAEMVEEYYRRNNFGLKIEFSREVQPLGTGGAIKNARKLIRSDPFFVLNGDCYCALDYKKFLKFHEEKKALASIALSELEDRADFGSIELDEKSKIVSFREKSKQEVKKIATGETVYVNAGIYAFSKNIFRLMPDHEVLSLERAFFQMLTGKAFYGYPCGKVFIDIGTPSRFAQAQLQFRKVVHDFFI